MPQRSLMSFACFAAAGSWPMFINWIGDALMSPLQRAARDSFCGVLTHTEVSLLGHCALCWMGSVSLIALGLTLLLQQHRVAPVRRRRSD